MKVLKTLALVVLAAILVLTSLAYMAYMGVERTFLSPAYYRDMFSETAVLSQVHAGFQEQMKKGMLEDMPEEDVMMPDINEEELLEVQEEIPGEPPLELIESMVDTFGEAFDEEWMEAQALHVIEDVLAVVKGQQDEFTAVIDLQDGMGRLREKLAREMEGWPVERLEEIGIEPGDTTAGAEMMLEEFDLPLQLDLAEIIPPEFEESLSPIQTARRSLLYIPYLVFAGIFFLNYQLAGFYRGMNWFGAALFVAGVSFLAVLQIIPAVLSQYLTAALEEAPLEPEVIVSLVDFTASKISLLPLIFSVVGLVLVIAALVLNKKKQEKGVTP